MNELTILENGIVPVYTTDKGDRVVDGRENIYARLRKHTDFEGFFVDVCKLKTQFSKSKLKNLHDIMDLFAENPFSRSAIVYIKDCILCEGVLPFNRHPERKSEESSKKQEIIKRFHAIFPAYSLLGCEVSVTGIGRIDLLATEVATGRYVIIELKAGGKNPSQQLVAYAFAYDDPILIGISEIPISKNNRISDVTYYTFEELGI